MVISIIALLIGILLPALGAARETARGVQCLSNQKQFGIGFAVYQADNDDLYPTFNWTQGLSRPMGVPSDPAQPEVPFAVCPEVPENYPGTNGGATNFDTKLTYQMTGAFGDYWRNGDQIAVFGVFGWPGDALPKHQVRAAAVKNPTDKIVLTESWLNPHQNAWNAGEGHGDWWVVMPNNRGMWKVHQTGSNVLLADGHASLFPTTENHERWTYTNEPYQWDEPGFDWTSTASSTRVK